MEEMLDVFDGNGNFVKIVSKKEAHQIENGKVVFPYYHKNVHIWFVNDKGECLVQKRAACKKNLPNLWDIPSAGHVQAGEDLISACQRETLEELDLKFSGSKFEYCGEFVYEEAKEFTYHYMVHDNTPIAKLTLQKEEVAEAKWLPFDEFNKFIYSNEFCPHPKEYKEFVLKNIMQFLKQTINN